MQMVSRVILLLQVQDADCTGRGNFVSKEHRAQQGSRFFKKCLECGMAQIVLTGRLGLVSPLERTLA
jgi:hypothetical protein